MAVEHSATFFIPSLDGGGAERVVVNLVNGLSAKGRQVDLLLFDQRGVYLDHVANGVRVDSLHAGKRWMRPLMLMPMVRYLRHYKPAALVVSGHSAFFLAWLARLFVPVKLIVMVHNTVSREVGVSKWVARILYARADWVVAVSKGAERDIRTYARVPANHLCTIYNPVDVEQIRAISLEVPDHPWFAEASTKVLLAVGSLSRQKNYPLLFRALKRAREQEPSLKLVVLGEGAERASLEKLVVELDLEDVVAMPGFVENPYAYMHSAYRFILSSRYEGFGMVLVEALCCGARVISTDCPSGPAEILEQGRWGLLVQENDVQKLAEAMLTGNDDFPTPEQASERALDFALENALQAYDEVIYG